MAHNPRKVVFDIETRDGGKKNGKLDPLELEIAVVGIHDSETDEYKTYLAEDLHELWKVLENTHVLIGYNSNHFDIPLLNKYYPGDLRHIKSIDLLEAIKDSGGKRIRLNSVVQGTLGKEKSGHGLQAVEWWQQGDVEKVRAYCLDDVRLTKELYDYALKHGSLKYRDLGTIREVKLDTSGWEEAEDSSLTHTLPF